MLWTGQDDRRDIFNGPGLHLVVESFGSVGISIIREQLLRAYDVPGTADTSLLRDKLLFKHYAQQFSSNVCREVSTPEPTKTSHFERGKLHFHARNPASIARECRTSDARDQREQAIYIFQPTTVLTGFSQLPTLNFPRTPCGALRVIQRGGVSLNDSKIIRQGEYTSCAGVPSGNIGFSVLQRAPGVSPGRGNDDRQVHILQRTIAILGMKLPRLGGGQGHRAHS